MYIDTHCHLDDEKLKNDIEAVVNAYTAAGVSRVIDVGCDLTSSVLVKEQSEKFESVYFAAGFHPMDVERMNEEGIEGICKLLAHEKCVAVGEIGLDYYWRKDDKERQKECFVKQLEIAEEFKLPINVHVRDAMGDALEILKQNKSKLVYGGVMHCFSGSKEMAAELMKLGMYISFGGTLTFKNARNAVEVATSVPEDMILSETDSPYLAPEPVRGTVNSPKNIPYIVERLASIRGTNKERFAESIMQNAKTLFYKLK